MFRSTNGETTAVAVSVVMLVVFGITVFITGIVIGHCLTKRRKTQSGEKLEEKTQAPEHGGPAHVYEDIQMDKEPELKQNVAYCPI